MVAGRTRHLRLRFIGAGLLLVLLAVAATMVLDGSSEPAEIRGATVSHDGRHLAVEYVAWDDGCGGEPHISTAETGASVTVTVEIHQPFELGTRMCLPVGRITSADVELATPLGDRTVINGSTARSIPVLEDQD